MSDEKQFSSHDKQLRILRKRGLDVPYSGTPKRILEKENYYNVINGYKDLFISRVATSTTPEQYKNGARFSEIFALYNFDNEIKMIFLKRILRIENNLKSEIAYYFSKTFGHDNYLKMENFELFSQGHPEHNKRLDGVIKLISGIQNDISNHFRHPSIKHYLLEHSYIPLWVLITILTFGRVSHFYEYMQPRERNNVARIYGVSDNDLKNLIKILSLCRNKCAHDERLYKFYNRAAINNNYIHNRLSIPKSRGGNPKKGKHDLFAVLIAIKILLGKSHFNKMVTELKGAVYTLSNELYTISIDDVLDEMGFPSNWEDIKNI